MSARPGGDAPGIIRIARRGDLLDQEKSGNSTPSEPVGNPPLISPSSVAVVSDPSKGDADQKRGILRINVSELNDAPPRFSSRLSRPPRPSPTRSSRGIPEPRPRFAGPVAIAKPVNVRAQNSADFPSLGTQSRPTPTSIAKPPVTESRFIPVINTEFASQEIFKALEQAKPAAVPKPPIPELTDEQKEDPEMLRAYQLAQVRMIFKDAQVFREFKMAKPVKIVDSTFQWCLRKGPSLDQLVSAIDPSNRSFTVVGVIGFQESGKSFILSQIAGQNLELDTLVFNQNSSSCSPTTGLDCYISREQRTIYLDMQAVHSAALLEEMIVSDRKPPSVSSEHVFVEHTAELLSVMFAAFLMSVCHRIVVVSSGLYDQRLLRFIRLVSLLKLGPVHKDARNDSGLFDHWPELLFVNNFCSKEDLFTERIAVGSKRIYEFLKDYPFNYNQDSEPKDIFADEFGKPSSNEAHRDPYPRCYSIPDAKSVLKDKYLELQYRHQMTLLRERACLLKARGYLAGNSMTEKDWFRHLKRCWTAVCKAPLVNIIAKELNVSNTV